MDVRYRDLIGLPGKHVLYDTYTSDSSRKLITRWRLSNTKLAIETGRYTKKERKDRPCKSCLVIEEEHHALFDSINYTHPNTTSNILHKKQHGYTISESTNNRRHIWNSRNIAEDWRTTQEILLKDTTWWYAVSTLVWECLRQSAL